MDDASDLRLGSAYRLLRKGRFDEVSLVDPSTRAARTDIVAGHLPARGHDPGGFDLEKIADLTDGFSGADLESVVVGALYRAFRSGLPLTTEALTAEAETLVPLSEARPEAIASLHRRALGRAVDA